MQLLDGFSVTVGGENKTGGNRWILLMELHEKKKILYRVFQAISQWYQMACGIIPRNELVTVLPHAEVDGY